MKKSAIQLYSIRDLMAQDVFSTLKETAKAGYTGVEFAGFFGIEAKEIRRALDEYGLVTAGTHTGITELADDQIEATIEYNLTIGNKNIIVPGLPAEMTADADAYRRTAELFNKIGERLAEDKLRLYFHNHNKEFEKTGDTYHIDILFANTEPRFLGMELDTYWAAYAGVNPIDVMNKYQERCDLLHLKDMMDRPDKRCTELGNGIMDLKQIIALGKKYNVQWYVMEQEDFDIPELVSITTSATYLNENL